MGDFGPKENKRFNDVTGSVLTEAQIKATRDALMKRRRVSIRLLVILGFLLSFVMTCGITLGAVSFITHLVGKQEFLEKATNFEFEIQQARRYEKDYFLYGTNLYDALEHTQNAENILKNFGSQMSDVIGKRSFKDLSYNLSRYKESLESIRKLSSKSDSASIKSRLAEESEIRSFGSAIVANASNVIEQERLQLKAWLKISIFVALAALVVLLIFEALMASLILRKIILSFGSFEKYTKRIAGGDFSPITPARKYRDEFTNLAMAINSMLLELKKREEQLLQSRKMAAVGNLTAGIAHELNNPLNNISLTVEALLDEFDEWNRDEKIRMLNDIFTQIERVSGTVANLLDFSRRDETSFEDLSVNKVLEKTLKLVSNEININKIKFEKKLGENLPLIRGNRHNLQQVFLNLLLNAIQAMPDGGELAVVSYSDYDWVKVDITDTGIGIPQENIEKLFEPFFTTKEVGKGTGLGLSICYGIIKKHNGEISVKSEIGKGSTFTIKLPKLEKI